MSKIFDVCVVGSGPAGIFASMGLVDSCKVLIIELGRRFKDRLNCRVISRDQQCVGCGGKCNIITGFGGAFCSQSGGVLSLYPAGSFLLNYFDSIEELAGNYETALDIWKKFSNGKIAFKGSVDKDEIARFSNEVREVGGIYKHFNGFRIEKLALRDAICRIEDYLSKKSCIKYESEVVSVVKDNGLWQIICRNGEKYIAKTVLFATGRKGNSYMSKQLSQIGVATEKTGIDIGIRLELESGKIDHLANLHPDVKIKFNINGEEVRTFCFCPKGRLTHFNQNSLCGTKSMNFLEGYIDNHNPSKRTNLSFLHRINFNSKESVWKFQSEFEEKYYAIGGRVVAQRYSDIGRSVFSPLPKNTTLRDYVLGSVFQTIPEKSVYVILEAMSKFNELMGGNILKKNAVICAPEIGNFWPEVAVDRFFHTNVGGIFIAGDTLGFTRGALQGSATGIRVAKGIKKFLGKE